MKNKLLFRLRLLITQWSILIGGQAIIEGIMMSLLGALTTSVHDPKGIIHYNRKKNERTAEEYTLLKLPIVIGIIGLYDSFIMI